jgi:glycosyltransferase involved in cell wall biosynthesis
MRILHVTPSYEHAPVCETRASNAGVSYVIPVRNGAQWLEPVLDSVLAQADGRPFEILAVEDGSSDESPQILARYAAAGAIRVLDGPKRGAAAALNEAIKVARYPIICQVDQDVVLRPGWMTALVNSLVDTDVAAAQGYYETPLDAAVWARVTGLDLEMRYLHLLDRPVNHVCTGNTAYRADALRKVGLFDESLGYGYDNDMSYRLTAAGYRLMIRPEARSVHRWRDSSSTYLVQQYGFGYGRLDLVDKHRHRMSGDDVSQFSMMLHAPLMAAAVLGALVGAAQLVSGGAWRLPAVVAAVILAILAVERLIAGVRAAVTFRNGAALLFPLVHLARDLAWVAALAVWSARRLRGVGSRPSHSMRPRATLNGATDWSR